MSFNGVLRPGHVQIRVLDLEESLRHYTDILGLHEVGRDAQGRIYLKAWDEYDHHSVVLRKADSPGMDFIGFKVADDATLAGLGEKVRAFGLDVTELPAGEMLKTGRRLSFVSPTGHRIELFAEKEQTGNFIPTTNPTCDIALKKGMNPHRFDHVLLYGDDIDGNLKLFVDVLGFNLSEQVIAGDGKTIIATFFTCSNKAHDIAFIRHAEKGKFHHASFLLDSWHEIGLAADIISREDVALDIGPTRHGITRGQTIYFFDPSGNRNEVFAGGYNYYPDHPTLTWTEDHLGQAIFYYERQLNERFLTVVT